MLFLENQNAEAYDFKFIFQKENLVSDTTAEMISIEEKGKKLLKFYVEDILCKCSFQYKFSYRVRGSAGAKAAGVTKDLGQGVTAVMNPDYSLCRLGLEFTSQENKKYTVEI
jgi:hypothetical protein